MRVLLIEHEISVRDPAVGKTEMQGRFEGAAASGDDALETFDLGSYDFAVCATGMTGVSGWEVAVRLRQIDSARHVLMFTGYGRLTGLERAKEIGTISAASVSVAEEGRLRRLTPKLSAPSSLPFEATA